MAKKKVINYKPLVLLIAVFVLLAGVSAVGLFGQAPAATPTPAFTETQGATALLPTATLSATPTPSPTATPQQSIEIKLAGDILLHDTSRNSAKLENGGFDFNPYFSLIKENLAADLSICNIESPVDAYGGNQNLSGYPRFNIPREIITALKNAGFNMAVTNNNHALDKGYSGAMHTLDALAAEGLSQFGLYRSAQEYNTPKIVEVKGFKIGLISFTAGTNGHLADLSAAEQAYILRTINVNSDASVNQATQEVKALRQAGAEFIIVNLHWGTEYKDEPSAAQRSAALALCEAGADIIYGLHPHCVQPIEKKTLSDGRTAIIAYSLGNFFADQISLNKPENLTQHGAILNLTLTRGAEGLRLEASYTPTFVHRDILRAGSLYSYRIVPAGKYALAGTRPDLFDTQDKWNLCKQAWERVRRVAGEDLPALQG